MTDMLVLTQSIDVSPALVYRALTNDMLQRLWLCDTNRINSRVGGNYFLSWNDGYCAVGEFTALEPDSRVSYTWLGKGEPGPSQVDITLSPASHGTVVEVRHSGLGSGEAWESVAAELQKGWKSGLENLKYLLENGLDLRIQRRPMMGVSLEGMNAGLAQKIGVPVTEGMLISGVGKGMAAANAGLQGNDVVVGMDGKTITDWGSMAAVLSSHRGGDTIQVEYYRGSEKHAVSMTLSQRPKPNIPPTPSAMAEVAQTMMAELQTELDQLMDGVPESAMSHRPAPEEWSANEVLAHLIWTERHQQMTMWGIAGGDDALAWPDNNVLQLAGTLAVYKTGEELAAELKRSQAETVAAILAIPASLVENKGGYAQLAILATNFADHVRDHFTQMRQAIAAAKEAAVAS
jgi:uncharacterized protein YndB with AHSA1/START domain